MSIVSKKLRELTDLSKRRLQDRSARSRNAQRRSSRRRLQTELFEQRVLLASDLTPFAFGGWDSPIVIASRPGTFTSDPITVDDTVYFDFGWLNAGTMPTGGTYRVQGFLDGILIVQNSNIPDTQPGSGFFFGDVNVGTLAAGTHTVEFRVDTLNQITESNEANNIFTRVFDVTAAGTEDFGDAPTAAQSGFANSYPTTLADNGARHTPLPGFQLGLEIDVEPDGRPSVGALDDDSLNVDDEDGVSFITSVPIGGVATAEVLVTNTAGVANPFGDGWIDFNQDGDWDDPGEQVFSGPVANGINTIDFNVPADALPGVTYARIRLHNGTTSLGVTGLASNGEVEDYAIQISTPGVWTEQGPHGTINGQLEANTTPDRRVTGAIHTVLAHPSDPDIAYIGGVNGGIWRTNNFTDVLPDWEPQTDFLESLAIGAMAFDPTDPNSETLVAGTGKYSSFAGFGGIRGPVYRTTDGGANWIQLPSNGLRTVGENISGIAARGNTIVVSSSGNFGGIFRSTDGGANFSAVSGPGFVSPNDDFSDLVEDPTDPTGQRLYAVSPGFGGSGGIYRSDDFGATWNEIANSFTAAIGDLLDSSNNVEMAISPQSGRLFAATLVSGQPRGVFHTSDPTAATPTWTQMDVPVLPLGTGGIGVTGASNSSPIVITSPGHGLSTGNFVVVDGVLGNTAANGFFRITRLSNDTFELVDSSGNGNYAGGGTWTRVTGPNPRPKDIDETGAQGRIHFSIAVDPTNDDIVYIGGDRQDQPNNPIGDSTFGGAVFRGDASIARNPNVAPSPQWDHLTHDIVPMDPQGGTANGTAPHADSREITFDANGNLVEVDDGGIYIRTSPRDNTGDWFSKAGTLGVIEFHDVAYDSTSNILIGGTQDNGTHFQQSPGNKEWDFLSGGDGGDVVVDTVSLAANNQSIRYSSSQNLGGFRRTTWDANNNLINTDFPSRTVTSGSAFDPAFKTPVELNAVDPNRLLILGDNGIYESFNQGDTMGQVASSFLGFLQDGVAYGGFQSGTPNADVFYAAQRDDIAIRTTGGGPVTFSDPDSSSSSDIRDVIMNSDDWANAFAIDNNSVFQTTDAGGIWTDITGNLMSIAGAALQSITFIPGTVGAIAVGANQGTFISKLDNLGQWAEVGNNLPNVLVYDLIYNATDDVLVAGTLGRGAWTFGDASTILAGSGVTAPPEVYLNEVVVDLDGAPDNPNEYVELRGEANQSLDDVFVVFLEGDSGSNLGTINTNHVVDLSGTSLGSNGFLAIVDDDGATSHPYTIDPAATVLSVPGLDVENASYTAVIVHVDTAAGGVAPVGGQDLDADDNGLDALPTGWTILDSVGVLDGGATDRAYSTIAFSGDADGIVEAGGVVIDTGFGADNINHVMRVGDTTGSDPADWVAFQTAPLSPLTDFEIVSATNPAYLPGEVITNHLGQTNPTFAGVPTPEINVQGGGLDIVDGDTTPSTLDDTDFGDVLTAGASDVHTFTIENLGTGPLDVTGITVTGTNAADFVVGGFTPGNIAIGSTATFTVTFDPSGNGVRNATINIASDDADENPYDFAVTGNGTVLAIPEINVQGGTPATDIVDGDVTPSLADGTDFGSRLTAGGSVANVFTIQNLGTAPLNVTAANVTGANAGDFVVSGFSSAPIAVGASATFTVTFDPSADGVRNATIELVNDDADENPYNFDVTGVGLAQSVLGSLVFNEVLPDPNSGSLNFDTDGDGTAETDDEFLELYNTTGAPLDISGLQFWDEDSDNYFTVPASTTLGANGFVVVVANIDGTGVLPSVPSGSHAFSAGGNLSLSNGGDNLVVYDPAADQYIQAIYNGNATDTPEAPPAGDYVGFSSTATRLGAVLDFGNDTDGTSRALSPDGDIANIVDHNTIGGGGILATPGDSNTAPVGTQLAIAPTNAVQEEGAGGLGQTDFTFTVTRTGDTVGSTSVDFAVTGSGANPANASDFVGSVLPTGTVNFADGETSQVITVSVSDDPIVEFDETFTVTLSNASAPATISTAAADGTIENDDQSTVIVQVVSSLATEDDPGNLEFEFSRDNFSLESPELTFNFSLAGTANPANDYSAPSPATLTFGAGQRTVILSVDPTADALVEPDETVIASAAPGTGYNIDPTDSATGTIVNDDRSTVNISVDPTSIIEDADGVMVYTVTRDSVGPETPSLAVDLLITGSATLGTDYSSTATGSVTFAAGENSATIEIDPTVDTLIEPDETVIITLDPGTEFLPGPNQSATGTIIDDDSLIEVTVDVAPTSVTEDGTDNLVYTFTRNGDLTGPLAVDFTTTGTASAGDFTQTVTGTVNFAPGSATAIVTVDPTADANVEPDETVILTVVAGSGYVVGGTAVATGTITNDDTSTVTVSTFGSGAVLENSGTDITYVFSRTDVTSETPALTVSYTTGGTATAGTDYTIDISGTVTFDVGANTATVTVSPNDDAIVEPNETVILTISDGSNYDVGSPNSATGTILNDDSSTVEITVDATSIDEDAAGVLTYTLTRTNVSAETPALVANISNSGTASDGSDYTTSPSGSVVFAQGADTATVTVNPTADALVEPDESVTISLIAGGGYSIGTNGSATATIVNDDVSEVSVSVDPASIAEDAAGLLTYTFTRSNVGAQTPTLTATFTTDGTATAGTDYAASATGSVTFAAGESTAVVTVDPTPDATVEPDETVEFTVTAGAGYNVGSPDSAVGTILNDDDVSLVSVAVDPIAVDEDGTEDLVFTFTRTGDIGIPLSVNFGTGGTASAGDYVNTAGTIVSFAPGSSTAQVSIDPTADTDVEPDETVVLTVLAGAGYNIGAPSSATGTILNDDESSVNVTVDPSSILEDASGALTYTFTRSDTTAETPPLTINFATAGSATAAVDYSASDSGTLTFATGESTATVTIDPTPDAIVEADESVILSVLSGTGYSVGGPNSATGLITNDDVSDVTVTVDPTSVLEDGSDVLTYTFTRSNTSGESPGLTINVDTTGTATAGTDYSGNAATLSFAAGQSTATITIDPTADTEVEPDETVILTVAAGAGYDVGGVDSATGTITNDDISDVSVAVDPDSILEDAAGVLTYTFTRSNAGAQSPQLTINFDTTGTATSGTDYTASDAGTVTFAVGQSTTVVTVDPTVDSEVEPDESVTLTVAAGAGYNIGSADAATGTILNDDISDVTVAVDPDSILEDAAGVLTYTFTRSNAGAQSPQLTINFDTTGTATSGTDYTASDAGTVTFAAGQSTTVVTVDPTVDAEVEPDESVTLTVAAGAGYNIGSADAATGTILNDDISDISVAVDPDSILEDAAGVLTYTFTRSNAGAQSPQLTINFDTTGTATSGTDYTPSDAGTVTFAAGQSTTVVTVDPTVDAEVEPDESVTLTVAAGAGYNIGSADAATGTILNDDISDVSVAVNPDSILEDAAGVLTYTFTRSNAGAQSPPLTINFDTTGTATSGTDYTASDAGTITFAAGQSTTVVTVDPTVDSTVELNETVTLSVASGAGYNVSATDSATGTITNDDASTISIGNVVDEEGDTASKPFVFPVTLTNPIDVDISMFFLSSAGSATSSDSDYTQTSGTLNITAGDTSGTITVDVNGDEKVELDENFFVTIGNLTNLGRAASIVDPTGEGTIVNDDSATISIDDVVLEEGDLGDTLFTFTVTLDAEVDVAISVDADTADGTATTANNDYVVNAATLNFAGNAGETQTFTVTINGDTDVEPDEDFFADLSNLNALGRDVAFADSQGVGTIVNDDAAPTPIVESIVYFNHDPTTESNHSPGNTGQRSIIRQIEVVFSGPINIPTGPVTDGSFLVESTSVSPGTQVGLTVLSSQVVGGKQVVVLGFTGTVLIEDLSENQPGILPMLEDGRYRLLIDGAKLGTDANGPAPGVNAVDDFFRFFGDQDGDEDVDLFDFARFRDYFTNGNGDYLFDFDDNPNTPLLDFAQFRGRFFTILP